MPRSRRDDAETVCQFRRTFARTDIGKRHRPARRPQASHGGYPRTVTEEPNPSAELSTNGVGPWRGELPDDPRYDSELLACGDSRNVIDEYRYWSIEAIVADLDTKRHPFHVAIENWQHDMNIGSIVRSANAFGAETVHIIGRRSEERRVGKECWPVCRSRWSPYH